MIPTEHELLKLLTPREREAVYGAATSEDPRATAARLGVAYSTVKNQRQAAMDKLGIHDVAALTRFSIRVGLIQA